MSSSAASPFGRTKVSYDRHVIGVTGPGRMTANREACRVALLGTDIVGEPLNGLMDFTDDLVHAHIRHQIKNP